MCLSVFVDGTNSIRLLVLSYPTSVSVANDIPSSCKSKNYLANHRRSRMEIDACGAPHCAVVCMANTSVALMF
jgi:hypothetical protein